MKDHQAGSSFRLAAAATVVTVACLSAMADEADYIYEDVRITGRAIHSFADAGQQVLVVLGDFRLRLGDRSFGGRDGVIWIQSDPGEPMRRAVTMYVEGKPAESPQLLTLRFRGTVTASGRHSVRPLTDSPFYQRAVAARKGGPVTKTSKPIPKPPAIAPASPDKPPAVVAPPPRKTPPPVPTKLKPEPKPTTDDVRRTVPPKRVPTPALGPVTKTPRREVPGEPDKTSPSPKRRSEPIQPVNFYADNIEYTVRNGRRVVVGNGNVYASRGNPDSAKFLELRSQAAVGFMGKPNAKDTSSPLSTRIDTAKIGGAKQAITGVYLEGDVIIAQGERHFRASRAYYDLNTDRAIILDSVFRTIQKQRNVPIYIRASQARALSSREMYFRRAKVTTSDFYTPSYHIGATRAYVMDNTPYDPETGDPLGEQSWRTRMVNTTFNVRGVPILYFPWLSGDMTQGNSALRTAQLGKHGEYGYGVTTEWHLFRLLGLVKPEGVKGRFRLDWYERGVLGGVNIRYAKRDVRGHEYSGYSLSHGLLDRRQKDDFGDERENIAAPKQRGRLLIRHKHFLPDDWQLQLELSYICDRNFLEQFFPEEFWNAKEQETLVYAKKQRDNWAATVLMQQRMNNFLTQTESFPELGFYLVGEPLLDDRLTFYHESRAGMKRYRPDTGLNLGDSDMFARLDTRNEVDIPLHVGPINLLPYAVGRATFWDDHPSGNGQDCRPYGQLGIRANTHIWRVYNNAESRLWDIHRLKHIITPEATAFVASTRGVEPGELFPMDPDIEEHLTRISGVAVGVRQRLQTKRGAPGQRRNVDWMRLKVVLGIYDNGRDPVPSDGRFFGYRPEYSIGRNHINADYAWHISDATTLLADMNYDIDETRVARANLGLAVSRDPRLRYYYGIRYIDDMNSAVGTMGMEYKINRKYSVSFFEQYDFNFNNGQNLTTSFTITRKLPRWYAGFTFLYDASMDELTMLVTFWPEGIPEVRISGGRMTLLGKSDEN